MYIYGNRERIIQYKATRVDKALHRQLKIDHPYKLNRNSDTPGITNSCYSTSGTRCLTHVLRYERGKDDEIVTTYKIKTYAAYHDGSEPMVPSDYVKVMTS
jgi:hypothetical protein